MSNLGSILLWLYPQAKPLADYRVQKDSADQDPYIAYWNVQGVAQPTVAEVMAREADWLAYKASPAGKMERWALPRKVQAALAVRAYSQWLTLPLARRNQIQAIIDEEATKIIQALS